MSLSTVIRVKSSLEMILLGEDEKLIDNFLDVWPIDAVLRLRCLNASMFLAVEAYLCRALRIRATLGRWFHEVGAFLCALDKCGGLVSGSVALQILGRHHFIHG